MPRRFQRVDASRIDGVAPVKLNLFLELLGKEPDGYHALESVFHELAWGDEVSVRLAPSQADDQLTMSGLEVDGPPSSNLALRAATAFRRHHPALPFIHITLHKNVPPGTGLGGGSSDASFVLEACQALCDEPLDDATMWEISRELGSDVPFFRMGGTAIGRNRGDQLESLDDVPPRWFVIALPDLSLSTAEVYSHAALTPDTRDVNLLVESLRGGPGEGWLSCFNRLESAAFRLAPALARLRDTLAETTQVPWHLTGSGSALFAPCPGRDVADQTQQLVERHRLVRVFTTRSA